MNNNRYEGSYLAILLRPLGTLLVITSPVMLYEGIKEYIIGSGFSIPEIIFLVLYQILTILIVSVLPGLGISKLANYLDKRAFSKYSKKQESHNQE